MTSYITPDLIVSELLPFVKKYKIQHFQCFFFITLKLYKISTSNLKHTLPETMHTCMARGILLALIIIELCPLFDLEICAQSLILAITRKKIKIFTSNLEHTLPETMQTWEARDIPLALIIIELCPFCNVEICAKSLTLSITRKPYKIFTWNLKHTLPETLHTCAARGIVLAFRIIELCPFFDLEICEICKTCYDLIIAICNVPDNNYWVMLTCWNDPHSNGALSLMPSSFYQLVF